MVLEAQALGTVCGFDKPAGMLWMLLKTRYNSSAVLVQRLTPARYVYLLIAQWISGANREQQIRLNSFFIESSCAVLMYDILGQSYKWSHNMEYITAGLRYLSESVKGEPTISVIDSMKQIISVFEASLHASDITPTTQTQPGISGSHIQTDEQAGFPSNTTDPSDPYAGTQLLPADLMLHFRESTNLSNQEFPQMDYDLDIFATDLFRFFPPTSGNRQDCI